MKYNNKKWFSIVQEHTDLSLPGLKDKINPYWYIPSVIAEYEGQLFVAELTNCRESKDGYYWSSYDNPILVFDFEFEALGKCIKEENVFHVDLGLKYVDNDYYSLTWSKTMMDKNDFDDHWMVIYKNPQKCATQQLGDIVVYHNMKKKFEIKNVYGNLDNRYQSEDKPCYFDFEPVFNFKRLKKNDLTRCEDKDIEDWVLIDGKECPAKKAELPLKAWDETQSPSRNSYCKVVNNYSPENSISVNEIKWNSNEIVKWKCFLGHEWTESVKSVTSRKDNSCFCPICKKTLPCITLDRDDTDIDGIIDLHRFVMKSLNIEKIEDVREAILPLYEEANKKFKQNKVRSMKRWINPPKNETIKYYFSYPNGRSSEIDMYLSDKYGSVQEISPFFYEASFSSENRDIMVLLEAYPDRLGVFSQIAELDVDALGSDVIGLYQYRNFMFTYNVFYRYMVLSIIKDSYENKNSNIWTSRYLMNELREYEGLLRGEKKEIYNQIVYEGKSLNKWKSEQALFIVVKYLFDDAIYQYHAPWLGAQSLDIYVPSINVGIEYQGIQHYEAVDFFGGEEGLKERKELDAQKKKLCKENKVKLIEWKYTKEITLMNAKDVLKKYINEE